MGLLVFFYDLFFIRWFFTISTGLGSALALLIVFGSLFVAVEAVRFVSVRLYRHTLSPTYASSDNSASIWSDKSTNTLLSLASDSAIVDYHWFYCATPLVAASESLWIRHRCSGRLIGEPVNRWQKQLYPTHLNSFFVQRVHFTRICYAWNFTIIYCSNGIL